MDIRTSQVGDNKIPTDSSGLEDEHAEKQAISYCALPAEIRNRIMRHALVPGQIHICPHTITKLNTKYLVMHRSVLPKPLYLIKTIFLEKLSSLREWMHLNPSSPIIHVRPTVANIGCQLLATCRQAYGEGHHWFYSLNTFYIPRGPLTYTTEYFSNLQPNHITLITSIGIRFGLQDLTSKSLEAVDRRGKALGLDPHSRDGATTLQWTNLALRAVEDIWKAKLRWIRNWTTLERVVLESRNGTLELRGDWMQVKLQGPLDTYVEHFGDGYEECSIEVAAFMRATSRRIKRSLGTELWSSWECRKLWLLAGRLWLESLLDPRDHSPRVF